MTPRTRRVHRVGWLLALAAAAGCDERPGERPETVVAERNAAGNLQLCDASGACQTLPNPDDCDRLVFRIYRRRREACQQCLAADGEVLSSSCGEDGDVACFVLTGPEPDCVVCYYMAGAVIYNSCGAGNGPGQPGPTDDDGGAAPVPDAPAAPVPDAGATPAPDSSATPAPDSSATPAPDSSATPAPDSSATPAPDTSAPPPPPVATPVPHPIFGVTTDGVGKLADIKDSLASLGRKPTVRIVFDHPQPASDYTAAAKSLHQVAHVMGEVLDSYYTINKSCRTDLGFEKRLDDYLDNQTLSSNVDIWEIGNEVNGEWLCKGNTSDVYWLVRKAYDKAKSNGQTTALTLFYYSKKCAPNAKNEMFTWIDNHIEQDMRDGLDYVIISHYETACPWPDPWDQVFKKLGDRFPKAWLGFSEVGTESENASQSTKLTILDKYYGLKPMHPRYVGGYFWWYFRQDMVPKTKALWAELDKYSKIWSTLYP